MRTPFAVGRLDRRTRQVTWVRARSQTRAGAPFPGPWSLEARVSLADAPAARRDSAAPAPDPTPIDPAPADPPPADPAPSPPQDGEQLGLL